MRKRDAIRKIIQVCLFIVFTILMLNGKMIIWLALYGFTVVTSFIFGRYFCSYICPMNTAMRISDTITKKSKIKIINMKLANFIPFFSLLVSILIMLITKKKFHMNFPLLLIYVPLSFVYALFFHSSTWHNYLCPYSIALKIGGNHSLYHYKVDESTCIGCMKCVKTCQVGAIKFHKDTRKAVINPALCQVCGQCVGSCKVNAIKYTSS